MIPVLKNYDYSQRLKVCSLPTVHYRHIRGDMIETYKIVTGIYDVEVTPKLYPAHSLVTSRAFQFAIRIDSIRYANRFVL